MITISQGLQHSLIVLEFLRNDEEISHLNIHVGTFTNCREVGLTFCIMGGTIKGEYACAEYFTWCIYAHRNSDEIIINGKKGID